MGVSRGAVLGTGVVAGSLEDASGGGGVALRVRGRFSRRFGVGGERTGVRGVVLRLLLVGVSSRELVRRARFAARSAEDFAASNKCQDRSSSGSLIAVGGVSALFDCPDSLLVPRIYAVSEVFESLFIQRNRSSICRSV